MDKDALRALLGAGDLTLDQLRAKNPRAADSLAAAVAADDRTRIAERIRGSVPSHIQLQVAEMEIDLQRDDVIEHVRGRLVTLGIDPQTASSAVSTLGALPPVGLQPDQPIGSHPAAARLIEQARFHEVLSVAGVTGATADRLVSAIGSPSGVHDELLDQLVANGTITHAAARTIGFTSALFDLVGDDTSLAAAIHKARLPTLGGNPPTTTEDLARLTATDWRQLFGSLRGLDSDRVASTSESLARRLAVLHPTIALNARLPPADARMVSSAVSALAPLYAHNTTVAGRSFDALDTTGLTGDTIETLRSSHGQLLALVRAYPGLKLAAALDDPQLSPAAKESTIVRRVGLVKTVLARLGDTQPLHLDYGPDSQDIARLGLNQLDASAAEKAMVVDNFKIYQRAWAISRSIDDTVALIAKGFYSATQVALTPYEAFHASAGYDNDKSYAVWTQARTLLADATLTAGAIGDVFRGLFDKMSMSNTPAAAQQYLKKLAGFEDLFGSLSFCDCDECESILGAAAYFVDLMKFADDNIRYQLASSPGHPLDLKTRRPDLWTLPLTCANTNDRIPTLEIVNEVLENFIATSAGYTGTLDDRAAIGTLVYENTLAVRIDSLTQPFHLPLARISAALKILGGSRAAIAKVLDASPAVLAQAQLGISPDVWGLITSSKPVLADQAHAYDMTFTGTDAAVDQVDTSDLAAAMQMSRAEVGSLVATHFVAAGGAAISIVAAKRNLDSVQNDVEWVQGLTSDALDRMNRLSRLWRKGPWSFDQLDRLETAIADTALGTTAVETLGALRGLQERYGLTVDELCSLVGSIPTAFFDRLFNAPAFVRADGALPDLTRQFVHPAFRTATPAAADPVLPRLLAGLGVDLDDLAALLRHLGPQLSQGGTATLDPSTQKDDDAFILLSIENISTLYRHARLARLLRVSVDALFQVLALAGLDHVGGIADVIALIDTDDWRRASGYSLDDLSFVTGATRSAAYPDPAKLATQLVQDATAALEFEDTVFAVSPGTTEQGSLDLLTKNASVVERTASRWRLRADIDVETVAIAVPTSATVATPSGPRAVTVEEVRAALRPYVAADVLAGGLGRALRMTTDKVAAIGRLVATPLTNAAVVGAYRGDTTIKPLVDAVTALLPMAVLFAPATWDATAIDFVRDQPHIFGAQPFPQTTATPTHPNTPFVDLQQLEAVATYARLAQRRHGDPPDTATDPADLRAVLSAFNATSKSFPSSVDAPMARVLGTGVLVVGMRDKLALPGNAASALDRLDRAAQLAIALGIDGETLGCLLASDYASLSRAADALVAAIHARFTDEALRAAKLEEAEQPVREAKRDGLTDYLIHSFSPDVFTSQEDLFEYFLIDVATSGCSTTSRIVAATLSVQLYVHRVIMNLEQDDLLPTDPDHVALRLSAKVAPEWSWRKNFRVWQANRKVFLWPENYIEPDLRDDKTPLFRELEQELLQTDISDENVAAAYAKYLKGFEEVTTLAVVGAYQDVAGGERPHDVLHLFGATKDDPALFYYRTCENLIASGLDPTQAAVWSPWQKINVQIAARTVTPVVYRGRLHLFWIDIKTKPFNTVHDGASDFSGYRHKMTMKFTTLRPDATWTVPQELLLADDKVWPALQHFGPGRGVISDPLNAGKSPRFDTRPHTEPIDDYTLPGINWNTAWLEPLPDRLNIRYRNFTQPGTVDLFTRALDQSFEPYVKPTKPQLLAATGATTKSLFCGTPTDYYWSAPAFANCMIDDVRREMVNPDIYAPPQPSLHAKQIATIPAPNTVTIPFLYAIPGSVEDAIIQVGIDVVLLQGSVSDQGGYVLRRIGTVLAEPIARQLFENGLDALLGTPNQLSLAEPPPPLTPIGTAIDDRSVKGKLDFKGAYGVYYRELFFHIPFLIANALNSRGRYEAAQRWYHFIFDPTASEDIDVTGVSPDEIPHRLLDRVWRYREFRGLDLERLRDILTDEVAIALYKKDPFNPDAIARRRISGYQKAIVMKYVDNLLDWADFLFTQFTMESVNEALMLYVMASDVLGKRPVELGDCGEGGVSPRDYEQIGPLMEAKKDVLAELETMVLGSRMVEWRPKSSAKAAYMPRRNTIAHAITRNPIAASRVTPDLPTHEVKTTTAPPERSLFRGLGWTDTRTASWGPALGSSAIKSLDKVGGRSFEHAWKTGITDSIGSYGWSVVAQYTPVFCVPPNHDLLAYWDRVEDRLYKIRHCMDIDGQKRELALFAPEIDPRLLVRMKAAGLSLDDVLGATAGDLPPYRFLYLVDRAKAFAASLSGFGAALLSALEKKDADEMVRLTLTHQKNLVLTSRKMRQLDIEVAEQAHAAAQNRLDAATYRQEFFDGLIAEERNGAEIGESIARHTASAVYGIESLLQFLGAWAKLIPQLGSPFAMKYGGVEVGGSLKGFGNAINAIAKGAEAIAASSALEASFARRLEGWKHERKLAGHDLEILQKELTAAELRLELANRALDLHDLQGAQLDEVIELTDGKFTSFGLFTWLAQQHQRLYRAAFQNALGVARLAEQAFRFERGDDTSVGLQPSYWDSTHAGLLAGEGLLVDLQTLERRYLETNYRTLEIDQPFALSQVAPSALVALRATGTCAFEIPEVYFDLFYPGHYRRRIKAVRLTIPCVTGPYVNVSATLELTGSHVRATATPGAALVEVPSSRSIVIATSTAQNDAGVFELSFRDERYMPFEGLGAVSAWKLTLPQAFPQFDYGTINDVIISISYTAEQDGALRDRVETANKALVGGVLNYFSNNPAARVFSLRQDFSSAFTRMVRSPVGTQVKIEINDRHFPLLFKGRTVTVKRAVALLRTAPGVVVSGVKLGVDTGTLDTFVADPTLGKLAGEALPPAFSSSLLGTHTFSITASGSLAPASPSPGDLSAIDADALLDILLYVEYQLA